MVGVKTQRSLCFAGYCLQLFMRYSICFQCHANGILKLTRLLLISAPAEPCYKQVDNDEVTYMAFRPPCHLLDGQFGAVY